MNDLFSHAGQQEARSRAPLAERMRPRRLEDFVGQEHLTGPGHFLRKAIESDRVPSLILWGPPGTGKTTLAHVIAHTTGQAFESLSAVLAGVKDLREVVARAKDRLGMQGRPTLLFLDEIHRFNKAQQDALLPHVESGTLTLIGATTENPSFEVNAALLSRCRVVTLRGLEEDAVLELLRRALTSPRGLEGKVEATDEALITLARASGGDGRRALTALEVASTLADGAISVEDVREALQQRTLLYDRGGDEHYGVISAFIKSLRGSDPDAALYWMSRMLEAGEDPLFVVRRMVIFASEDVGNAEPQALPLAIAAMQAVRTLGMPEAALPMAQAVTFLALAPKSNASYKGYLKAREAVVAHGTLPVPEHLRNASSSMAKQLGWGAGYQYPHDFEGHHVAQSYLPQDLLGARYFEASDQGAEKELRERHRAWLAAREAQERDPGEEG